MVAEEPGILRSDEEKNLCERAGRGFLFFWLVSVLPSSPLSSCHKTFARMFGLI